MHIDLNGLVIDKRIRIVVNPAIQKKPMVQILDIIVNQTGRASAKSVAQMVGQSA